MECGSGILYGSRGVRVTSELMDVVGGEFEKSLHLVQAMAADGILRGAIIEACSICAHSLRQGGKLLFVGNGGSAAAAQHWAAELVGRFNFDRAPLFAMALTTDTSILSAVGNDYGYEDVFARQIEAVGRKGDVLFALSTSGKSRNVLRAATVARSLGLSTIGLTGGGRDSIALAELSHVCLRVPSTETPKIQEGHEMLGHMICGLIERVLFGSSRA